MARLEGWQEAFKNHAVHGVISDLEAEMDELADEDEDSQWGEFCLRVSSALSLTKRTLDNSVPVLFNEQAMRNLQGSLQNVVNSVRNFRSDTSQTQHLNQAEPQIDAVVAAVTQLPMPSPPITGDVFSATAERFRTQVDGLLRDLNEHATGYEERLEHLTVDTASAQSTLDKLKGMVDEYNAYIKNAQDGFEKTNVERFDGVIVNLEERASDLIAGIERQQEKAKEILGLISEEALTTDYGKSAIQEASAANRYRWASIASMFVAVATLVWLVYDVSKDGFTWESAIIRILIAAVLFVPSGYLARESLQHRKKAGYYKRVALELSVLGPFIRDLDVEDRKLITKELVNKYFGRFDTEDALPSDDK